MKLRTKQTTFSSDPLEVFERLTSRHDYCFLLETLGDTQQPQTSGRSYVGVAPKQHFSAKQGRFYIDGQATEGTDNPYDSLRQQISFDPALPTGYIGGLVGYSSHEAICNIEPSLDLSYDRDFPDFEYGLYRDGLVFEAGKAPEYFYYGQDRADLYNPLVAKPSRLRINFKNVQKNLSEYQSMLHKALEDIRNGRVFQVVLANKYEYQFSGDLLRLYREIRRVNPSPYMFFIKFGDVITLGASPELLLHTSRDGKVYLEALAGTIRRGKTETEDRALGRQLLQDKKEVAEHNMLVDLARNDVGRVSKIGSVQIDSLMYIKKLSHVQHICSIISGRLELGRDAFDAMAASFPAGTLVGAPKIEAAKIINELEGYERGPYGGSVGYISFSGDCMQAVNIRSVSAVANKLFIHSGSGIVYDSQSESEYKEISDKKAAMDRAMAPFLTGGSE